MPHKEKRLTDAKAATMEADIRVLRTMMGVTIPRVTLRSTPGYEPLALLGHSTFQVVRRSPAAVSRCYQRGWAAVAQIRSVYSVKPVRDKPPAAVSLLQDKKSVRDKIISGRLSACLAFSKIDL